MLGDVACVRSGRLRLQRRDEALGVFGNEGGETTCHCHEAGSYSNAKCGSKETRTVAQTGPLP